MRKRLNRKGFTLVELLAVIVVLAILVLLAMPRVTSMMEKSRVNSFAVEANEIAKLAETAYNDKVLNGVTGLGSTPCFTVDQLISEGYLDKDKGEVQGVIVLEIPDASAADQSVKTHMYLSKDKYFIKNLTSKAKTNNVSKGANKKYSACSNTSAAITCTSDAGVTTVKCINGSTETAIQGL